MATQARRVRHRWHSPSLNTLDSLESRLLLSTMTPAAIRTAYGFNNLSLTGAGQTIAIVDAYDAPTIGADLDVFDKTFSAANGTTLYAQFGAASSFLTKHAMTSTVRADGGWAQEVALDVEWAHAIAPSAKILLVEAASASLNDLLSAVNYARNQTGVSAVSMSWGGGEFSTERNFDSYFTTPAGHTGVTFVASSGDVGGMLSYPAVSPNVLAVGGTSLNLASGSAYFSESAWSGSGGGISGAETAPAGQTALTGTTLRTSPDVSYDADPNSGFYVYDSYAFDGYVGWMGFGGTSAGAPQWAALVALADQGRAQIGKSPLDGATQTIPALYAAPASHFHDITTGGTSRTTAATGYDLATGRGSPLADQLVNDLVAFTVAPATITPVTTTPVSTRHTAPPRNRRFHALIAGENQLASAAPAPALTSEFNAALYAALEPTLLPALHTGDASAPILHTRYFNASAAVHRKVDDLQLDRDLLAFS